MGTTEGHLRCGRAGEDRRRSRCAGYSDRVCFDGQPVDPVFGSMNALIYGFDPDPAVAAFIALHDTLLAYGPHWKDLVNELEAAFPRIVNWTIEGSG